ncbi:Zinc finger C2H2-type [Trinorchestia longiramus]|nr:Zinc finger C2H2-type [Trinorchestia longiramus]
MNRHYKDSSELLTIPEIGCWTVKCWSLTSQTTSVGVTESSGEDTTNEELTEIFKDTGLMDVETQHEQTSLALLSNCAIEEMTNNLGIAGASEDHFPKKMHLCSSKECCSSEASSVNNLGSSVTNSETIFYLDSKGNLLENVMTSSTEMMDNILPVKFDGDSSNSLISIDEGLSSKDDNQASLALHAVQIEGDTCGEPDGTSNGFMEGHGFNYDQMVIVPASSGHEGSHLMSMSGDGAVSDKDRGGTGSCCSEEGPNICQMALPGTGKRARKPTHKGEDYKQNVLRSVKSCRTSSGPRKAGKAATEPQGTLLDTKDSTCQEEAHVKVESSMGVQHLNEQQRQATLVKSHIHSTKKRRRKRNAFDSISGSVGRRKLDKSAFKKSTSSKNGHRRPTFHCIKCPMSFPWLSELKSHFLTHTDSGPPAQHASAATNKKKSYSCGACGEKFRTSKLLCSHEQREHLVEGGSGGAVLQCKLCPSSFSHAASFKVHMRAHRGEKPYQCSECGAEFVQSGHLMIHKRIHTGEKPYTCDICSVQFKQISHLKTHVRTHTLDRPYKCSECNAAFAQNSSLKRHIRSHTGEKPYKCGVCSMTFVVKSNLQRHSYTHTGEKPYPCDLCTASFGQVIDLKRHKISHTGIKPYKCDLCEAQFSRKNNLKWHRLTHAEGATYKCEVCEVPFATPGDLRFHKRSHDPPKPYQCSRCPASFQQYCSLTNHQLIHTGQMPKFKRKQSKSSPSSSNASSSNSNGGGGARKPFVCSVCKATFCEKRNWRRHVISVHSDLHAKEKRLGCTTMNASTEYIGKENTSAPPNDIKSQLLLKSENESECGQLQEVDVKTENCLVQGQSGSYVASADGASHGQFLTDLLSPGASVTPEGTAVVSGVIAMQQQEPQGYQQMIYQSPDPLASSAITNNSSLLTVPSNVLVSNSSSSDSAHYNVSNSNGGALLSQLVLTTGPNEVSKVARPAGSCSNHAAHILTLVDAVSNHWQAWCLCETGQPGSSSNAQYVQSSSSSSTGAPAVPDVTVLPITSVGQAPSLTSILTDNTVISNLSALSSNSNCLSTPITNVCPPSSVSSNNNNTNAVLLDGSNSFIASPGSIISSSNLVSPSTIMFIPSVGGNNVAVLPTTTEPI